MEFWDDFLNIFKKPKEEESKGPSKDVESQLGTTISTASTTSDLYEQLEQAVKQQNQSIQDLCGGVKAQQKITDIAGSYQKMPERRAAKEAKEVDSSVPATSSQEARDEIKSEDSYTRYQQAIVAMEAVLKGTSTMDESARMKSMEAPKPTFAQLARQAKERTDRDLGERSNQKTSSKDGDKPPLKPKEPMSLDDLLSGAMR
jgi:hypothetical protein